MSWGAVVVGVVGAGVSYYRSKENKEDGSVAIEPDSKNLPVFQKELNELLNVDVDLNGFKKIKLSQLSKCELSPQDMANMEFVIEE